LLNHQIKVIDGVTFQVQQLPAMRATKLLVRLGKILGPAAVAVDDVALGIQKLFDGLDPELLEDLIKSLFDGVQVADPEITKGKLTPVMPVFDLLFMGRMGLLFQALKFALEVNYGSFLGDLSSKIRGAVGALPLASPTPGPVTD
jgi:hypothetical protein